MPKRLFNTLALTGALVLLLTGPANAEVISKIAAVVNDAIITTHQLDQAFEQALSLNPAAQSLDPGEKDKLRRQVLDQLIEQELFNDRVQQLRLKVSDEDVDAAIQDVRRQNNLTLEQLKSALQQQGMDYETYRENLRQQILRYKLIGLEVQSKAEVTSAEVREYYRENIDRYRDPPYMQLGRLSFPIPNQADREQVDAIRALAIEAKRRLEAGESIETLLVSYATAGVDGGDMGRFRIGELTEDIDRAVRDLKTDEVSAIVALPNGFHLFRMQERSDGREKPFDEVRDEIEQTLIEQKREQAFKEWNRGLRKDAYIDIRI